MTPKGRIGGKTPERVVTLVTEAVSKSSQSAVARESGLGLLTVQRCLKGIGEPSQATLEKLAAYLGVTVAWLRGENEPMHKKLMQLVNDLEARTLSEYSELSSEAASQERQNQYQNFIKEIDLLRNETRLEWQSELEIASPLIEVMQTQIKPAQWEDAEKGLRHWLDKKRGIIKD